MCQKAINSDQFIAQVCHYASDYMYTFVNSLLSPDIEDDGPGDHLICNDEEWRWRTVQHVRDVILDGADTVPTPDLQRNTSLMLSFYAERFTKYSPVKVW